MVFATKDSWNTSPMPDRKESLSFKGFFTEEQMAKIRVGFIPKDMDDKWFIYTDDSKIYFHRSWTGNCIYRVHFKQIAEGFEITQVWVNRDLD